MDMSENAPSDSLPAVSDNGIYKTRGPQHIKLLGPAIRFEGLVGAAGKQSATRKKVMRRMLQDRGHRFGDDVSEDMLMSELQKQYPGRRVKIIVINVNPRDRQSVLNGMKYMDKFQPRSRNAMLDYAIANLGMLDQEKDRDKLCEAIAKNRDHLGPQHIAALEGMSRNAKVAQALTEAGYATSNDRSYADMVKDVDKFPPTSKDQFLGNAISHLKTLDGPGHANERTTLISALADARERNHLATSHLESIAEMARSDHDLTPLIDAQHANQKSLPPTERPKNVPNEKNSARTEMIRGRETVGRGSEGLSL